MPHGWAEHWQKDIIEWLKIWQPLLGGILAVLAACIFALSILKAAHILAKHDKLVRVKSTTSAASDLRFGSNSKVNDTIGKPVGVIEDLEQLRSLVRSALSAAIPADGAPSSSAGARRILHERIIRLRINKASLAHNVPKDAHVLLDDLSRNMDELDKLVEKDAATATITASLIQINSIARNLMDVLSRSDATRMWGNTPQHSP